MSVVGNAHSVIAIRLIAHCFRRSLEQSRVSGIVSYPSVFFSFYRLQK